MSKPTWSDASQVFDHVGFFYDCEGVAMTLTVTTPDPNILGPCPNYRVNFWGRGCSFGETFEGENAFGMASDYYDMMVARKDVRSVHFTRWDGKEWCWVVPPFSRENKEGDSEDMSKVFERNWIALVALQPPQQVGNPERHGYGQQERGYSLASPARGFPVLG
jgi:hypothetical protein